MNNVLRSHNGRTALCLFAPLFRKIFSSLFFSAALYSTLLSEPPVLTHSVRRLPKRSGDKTKSRLPRMDATVALTQTAGLTLPGFGSPYTHAASFMNGLCIIIYMSPIGCDNSYVHLRCFFLSAAAPIFTDGLSVCLSVMSWDGTRGLTIEEAICFLETGYTPQIFNLERPPSLGRTESSIRSC